VFPFVFRYRHDPAKMAVAAAHWPAPSRIPPPPVSESDTHRGGDYFV